MEEPTMTTIPQTLSDLYQQTFHQSPLSVVPLKGAGSNRQYYRISGTDGTSSIGVIGTSVPENKAFCALAHEFAQANLAVPQVLATSADFTCYLQEDLGRTSLFDFLKKGRDLGGHYNEAEEQMLHQVISQLPTIQILGDKPSVYAHCYPLTEMNARSVHFDLNYFKYNFLKLSGIEFNELALENDFDTLCQQLLSIEPKGFQYRDFQARNVMLHRHTPYYIDFQGGRRGPLHYDLASFLWQASAHYTPSLRSRLIHTYMQSLRRYTSVNETQFLRDLQLVALFRCLQVLGAYGFRGLWEGKNHFLESIPPALRNLDNMLQTGTTDHLPQLKTVCQQLIQHFCLPKNSHTAQLLAQDNPHYLTTTTDKPTQPLIVDVISFSFKKGLPTDNSGNGGGYIFDCRSTHNPGRFAEYRTLTGLDTPVRTFLEEDGEILQFLRSVVRLADFHVQRFQQRGFTHVQFAFGCTGGQHRSVYSAQYLAEHLHKQFGVEVHLQHRELHIQTILP